MAANLKNLFTRRRVALLLGIGLLGLGAGCQEEKEIRTYEVPRASKGEPGWRLLGAMIPRETQVWFFRLDGPKEQIAPVEKTFEQFVKSIRFTGKEDEPITWKLPEGWEQKAGDKQFRYATIRINSKKPLDMSVIPLPREGDADSARRNLIRWRDQLGLDPEPEPGDTRQIDVAGVPVTLVDITGYQKVKAPMFAGGKAPPVQKQPRRPQSPITYDVPEGWQQLPAGGIRLAAFAVEKGGDKAEFTVIPLAGQAGTVLANVNRWREEVKLPPISEAKLKDEVRPITVDGAEASYVDLAGPELRTLAVMLVRNDSTWFFKMRGPNGLVGNQKNAFESFVKSVKFKADGGN